MTAQVAIPLATMNDGFRLDASRSESTAKRSRHVAIIDENPRRDAARKQALLTEAQAQRAVGYGIPRALPGALDRRAGQRLLQRVALTVDQLLRMLN